MRRPGSGRCTCCFRGTCWSRQAYRCTRCQGKTKIWNAGGLKPPVADVLTARARVNHSEAVVWRGDPTLDVSRQGLNVLGVPVGHPQHVAAQLHQKGQEQALLFERIPHVVDVQIAWLLLTFCAATRANYWLRTVPPELTAEYARVHDNRVLQCLCDVLHIRNGLPGQTLETASLPLTLGGLGVGGSGRVRDAAFWGSWADCLEMVKARHPQVAQDMMTGFRSQRSGCLSSVTGAVNRLLEVGVHVPEWKEIADGLRPEDLGVAEWEPCEGRGWQRHASATVHDQYREQVVWPHLSLAERALVRSQSGPLASVPFTALPIHRISRMDPEPFRVLLLRRLRMPLPLNVRACRCGRLLDVLGHHRAACSRVGELGKRGFAAESAVAQICREGGARVSTNVMLRDLDISPPHSSDGRRLEVVAEGLCLFGGCQLALDATVVSTLHGDGTHRRKADVKDGVALKEARRSKEATYPELCRGDGRARLVVIAGEVGGRWSQETKDFLWCLACEKSKSSPRLLQGSVRVGWYRRWCCLLACSTAKAVACSLVGHRGSPRSGDQVPSAHSVWTCP